MCITFMGSVSVVGPEAKLNGFGLIQGRRLKRGGAGEADGGEDNKRGKGWHV
jgi:hypothetical protein